MRNLFTMIRSAGYRLTEIFQRVYLGYLRLLCFTFQTTMSQVHKDDPKTFIKTSLLGFKH